MTAEEHNRTLALFHFIYGGIHGLTLAVLVILVLVAKVAVPVSFGISSFWINAAIVAIVVAFSVVVLLPLIAGYGLRKRTGWARPVTLLTGVVSLINVPLGTALGIYSIKFFRSAAGSSLYGGSATSSEVELENAMQRNTRLRNLADRWN